MLVVSCGCIDSQSGEYSEQEASGVTCEHEQMRMQIYKDLSEKSSNSPEHSKKWCYFLN